MEKQEPKIFCLQEICLTAKDTHRLKVEGWKEKIHVIENDKKKQVLQYSYQTKDFKTKSIKK